jgi:hypothetical protein
VFAQFVKEDASAIKWLIEDAPYGFETHRLKELSRSESEIQFSSALKIDGTKNHMIYVDAGFKAQIGQCTYKMDIMDGVSKKNSESILEKYKKSLVDVGENKYSVEPFIDKEKSKEGFYILDEETTAMVTLYKQKNKADTYDLKMDIFYFK